MAILKSLINKSYDDENALNNVIRYIIREGDPSLIGCYGVTNASHAAEQIQCVADVYEKTQGRQLRHFILSFDANECLCNDFDEFYDQVYKITGEIARYYSDRYQIVYAVHQKVDNPHAHIVMGTVDYNTGKKFTDEYGELYRFKQHAAQVLQNYGYRLYV